MLVSNHMIKRPVSGVIEAVIEENLLYHCLKRLNINSYNLRGDRVIEDLQETSYADKLLHVRLRLLHQSPQQRYSPCHIDGDGTGEPHGRVLPP